MLKTLKRFKTEKKINPPRWMIDNTHYLCEMGSVAYGVSSDYSDVDVYGFCVPPIDMVFPNKCGYIEGFSRNIPKFDQWSEHHIKDKSSGTEYDFAVYGIVKYFRLVADNNPNMIDSLFVPRRCVLHSTPMGEYLREQRKEFLHKGCWPKFKGYSYSQMSKMKSKTPAVDSKRFASFMKYGYDLKYAYHLVRLLNEVEQILVEGDLDLQRSRKQLKSIRAGEWKIKDIYQYAEDKEFELEKLYHSMTVIPYTLDEKKIYQILINCLEMHFGCLENVVKKKNDSDLVLDQIRKLVGV